MFKITRLPLKKLMFSTTALELLLVLTIAVADTENIECTTNHHKTHDEER